MKGFKEFIPLWKLVKEDRKKIIFYVILLFLSSLSSLAAGYLMGDALESVLNEKLKYAILLLVIYFIINVLVDHALGIYARNGLEKTESKISRRLAHKTFTKVLNLPAVAFEEKSSGEIINRISQDCNTLSFTFGRIVRIVSGIVTALILTIYITFNSYIMMLEIIVLLTMLGILLKIYSPKIENAHKIRKKKQDKHTYHACRRQCARHC